MVLGIALLFLNTIPTVNNVNEKDEIFKIIELKKLRGIADATFDLKRFFPYINNRDKFLV